MTAYNKNASLHEKLAWWRTHALNDLVVEHQKVEKEMMNNAGLTCVCGKLATGLHMHMCAKFHTAVHAKTVENLEQNVLQDYI